MKQVMLLLFAIACGTVSSQTILVIDNITRQPLAGVSVLRNGNFCCLSNEKGEFQMHSFLASDTLLFSKAGYLSQQLSSAKAIAQKQKQTAGRGAGLVWQRLNGTTF